MEFCFSSLSAIFRLRRYYSQLKVMEETGVPSLSQLCCFSIVAHSWKFLNYYEVFSEITFT